MKNCHTTPRQLDANRANAQKSTGPTTPEGKAISSQNASTHGITAFNRAISIEEKIQYDALRFEFLDRFRPAHPYEEHIVDEMVHVFWHIRRIRSIEDAHFELEIADPDLTRDFTAISPAGIAALAHGRLNESGELALCNRQLSRLNREFHRLQRDFLELRRELPLPPDDGKYERECEKLFAGQNEPIPNSEHPEAPPPAPDPAPPAHPISAHIRRVPQAGQNEPIPNFEHSQKSAKPLTLTASAALTSISGAPQ